MASVRYDSGLARLFARLASYFYDPDTLHNLYVFFIDIAFECFDSWYIPDIIGDIFYDVGGACGWISSKFHDICETIDYWAEELDDLWDEIDIAWNKAAAAYTLAASIAGVIGTTFSQIVQFIKDHAEVIYQYITENIYNTYNTFKEYIYNTYTTIYETVYNTYNTFREYIYNTYNTIKQYIYNTYNTIKEYITNVYQTFTEIFNTYITEIIGVAEDWVRDFVAAALAPFAAPFNLVNLWFDAIQDFFNDPLGWLWDRFTDWFLGPE